VRGDHSTTLNLGPDGKSHDQHPMVGGPGLPAERIPTALIGALIAVQLSGSRVHADEEWKCAERMTREECLEHQLRFVATVFGSYKNEIARLETEIAHLRDLIGVKFGGAYAQSDNYKIRLGNPFSANTVSCPKDYNPTQFMRVALGPGEGEGGAIYMCVGKEQQR
jgi:hypothetical protein